MATPIRSKRRGRRLYYPKKATTLYYVKFYPEGIAPVYKIGITTRSVEYRFKYEKVPYDILWTKQYKGGRAAYIQEQRILAEYNVHRLPYTKILKTGNSELFQVDIRKYSNKGSL